MATLKQAAQLIATSGANVHYHLEGEPGVGKTSILPMIEKYMGANAAKYQFIYVDCPTKDIPDIALPRVDEDTMRYALSELWGFEDPRPKVIMLDEFSKVPNILKPIMTRLILEKVVGDRALPEGSMTFSTGNMAGNGVGDTMQGHINNRVTNVQIGKPTSEAWIAWALDNNVNEMIITAVYQFPHVMQSYLDDPKGDNPYIFNPKRNTGAFASPRSLYKAGFICDNRQQYGFDLTHEALQGTVGKSFAGDVIALATVADTVPTWEAIMEKPKTTKVPTSPAAQLLLVFGSINQVTAATAPAFVEYFFRFDLEVRMLWARQFRSRIEAASGGAQASRLDAVLGVKQFKEVLLNEYWVFN